MSSKIFKQISNIYAAEKFQQIQVKVKKSLTFGLYISKNDDRQRSTIAAAASISNYSIVEGKQPQ